jgi:hypothetical protein
MIDNQYPLVPKGTDGILRAILLARLSQPKETAEESAAAMQSSIAVAKKYLESVYSGPIEYTELSEQISGMVVDRATILATYDLVQKGNQDLVLCEELRCVGRNPAIQITFVQNLYDSQANQPKIRFLV